MAATNLLVARRYARAALDIAVEHNAVEQWRADLDALARVWNESPIAMRLRDPKLGRSRRMTQVRDLLGEQIGPLTLNLVYLLIERGRVELVPHVATAFNMLLREHEGRVEARVTTAVELTTQQRESLRNQLAARTGRIVDLDEIVDPSIIGGLVIRVDDELIDASVSGRLRRLEQVMSG